MQGKERVIIIVLFVIWLIWVWAYAIYFFLLWNNDDLENLWSASILWNVTNQNTWENLEVIDPEIIDNDILSWDVDLDNVNALDNSNSVDNIVASSNNVYLHIPSFFNSFNLNKFKTKYEAKHNVTLIIKSYDDMDEYFKWLSSYLSGSNSNIDIFMIPTTRLTDYSNYAHKLEFAQNNVSWLFNRIFADLVDNKDYTYIPYSIDPFVTIAKSWLYEDNKQLTLSKIKETVLTSWQNSWFKIKFLFWIWLKEWLQLKVWKQPFEDYFLIMYNLLFQSTLTSNNNVIKTFLDFADTNSFNIRSNSRFNNLINIHKKNNSKCILYKKVCLMSNNNVDAYFGFLSDLDVFQTFFANSKVNIDNISVHNFIQEWQSYMVKWRGFFINKNSKQLRNSVLFINDYIQESVEWNSLLWWNTFSAFNNIFDKQKMNLKFRNIVNYSPNFYLLTTSSELQKSFMNWTKTLDVVKWTYNLDLFLTNLSYSRWF